MSKQAIPPVKKNAFVHKLYQMLLDPKLLHLIWWTDTPEMDTFALFPGKEFATALTGYFKHGNVASFVRQLHMYGFHKVADPQLAHIVASQTTPQAAVGSTPSLTDSGAKEDVEVPPVWEFKHLLGRFRKDDELLLVYIKRRLLLNSLRNGGANRAPLEHPPELGHAAAAHQALHHPHLQTGPIYGQHPGPLSHPDLAIMHAHHQGDPHSGLAPLPGPYDHCGQQYVQYYPVQYPVYQYYDGRVYHTPPMGQQPHIHTQPPPPPPPASVALAHPQPREHQHASHVPSHLHRSFSPGLASQLAPGPPGTPLAPPVSKLLQNATPTYAKSFPSLHLPKSDVPSRHNLEPAKSRPAIENSPHLSHNSVPQFRQIWDTSANQRQRNPLLMFDPLAPGPKTQVHEKPFPASSLIKLPPPLSLSRPNLPPLGGAAGSGTIGGLVSVPGSIQGSLLGSYSGPSAPGSTSGPPSAAPPAPVSYHTSEISTPLAHSISNVATSNSNASHMSTPRDESGTSVPIPHVQSPKKSLVVPVGSQIHDRIRPLLYELHVGKRDSNSSQLAPSLAVTTSLTYLLRVKDLVGLQLLAYLVFLEKSLLLLGMLTIQRQSLFGLILHLPQKQDAIDPHDHSGEVTSTVPANAATITTVTLAGNSPPSVAVSAKLEPLSQIDEALLLLLLVLHLEPVSNSATNKNKVSVSLLLGSGLKRERVNINSLVNDDEGEATKRHQKEPVNETLAQSN